MAKQVRQIHDYLREAFQRGARERQAALQSDELLAMKDKLTKTVNYLKEQNGR